MGEQFNHAMIEPAGRDFPVLRRRKGARKGGAEHAPVPGLPGMEITLLPAHDQALAELISGLLVEAFADPERYGAPRLREELRPGEGALYRRFFLARQGETLLGVGGVKAADWASNTHVLYLSAVAPLARGQGVARALVAARVSWVRSQFGHGRVLVSSHKTRRFTDLGFRSVSDDAASGRQLLVLDF